MEIKHHEKGGLPRFTILSKGRFADNPGFMRLLLKVNPARLFCAYSGEYPNPPTGMSREEESVTASAAWDRPSPRRTVQKPSQNKPSAIDLALKRTYYFRPWSRPPNPQGG